MLSDLPPAGPLDRARLADRRHDVRDLLQREGSSQRPAASRALFVQEGRLFHRLRQSWHAISARCRLGDGFGDFRRCAYRLGLDRRRRDGGERFPLGAGVRLRLPGAGHSQRRQQPVGDLVLPGHCGGRERQVRGARPRLRHSLAARRRQRLSCGPRRVPMGGRAGARQSGSDADRMGDLPRRRPFDLGRSVEISPQGRMGRLAARRSGRTAQSPPHPHRGVERGAPPSDAGRGRRRDSRRRQGSGEPRHAA